MKTLHSLSRVAARPLLAAALVLTVPLVAMQFTGEVAWTLSDFVIMGALVSGTGVTFELALMKSEDTAYRLAAVLALGAAFLLFWVAGAVGVIGASDPDTLLARTEEELRVRGYSPRTRETYLDHVRRFLESPVAENGPPDAGGVRRYVLHLLEKRVWSRAYAGQCHSALKFFYRPVCSEALDVDALPRLRRGSRLPKVLTRAEMSAGRATDVRRLERRPRIVRRLGGDTRQIPQAIMSSWRSDRKSSTG